MHIAITPTSQPTTTELWTRQGLLQEELPSSLIKKWGHRAVIIADSTVADLYGTALASRCNAEIIVIPKNGYAIKSRETKQWLENELFKRKYGRDTVLLALGGGALTDLVGFIAATYLRGIPLILIPTTLLAMVDAAIGGKTSIDTEHGKNLLGSYYPAKAIISDLSTLESLPEAEWNNGLAEILKAALIQDASLWPLCKGAWRTQLDQIAQMAIQVKISTIQQDPFEKGLRRILNFGHTVAHAIESAANYQISHGEAVAIGLMAESYLSMRVGLLAPDTFQEIRERIESVGFTLQLPAGYTRAQFLEAMTYDKKNLKGAIRFTLIEQIGKVAPFDGEYCCEIEEELVLDMTLWMENVCYLKGQPI